MKYIIRWAVLISVIIFLALKYHTFGQWLLLVSLYVSLFAVVACVFGALYLHWYKLDDRLDGALAGYLCMALVWAFTVFTVWQTINL